MKLAWTDEAWDDYLYWQSADRGVVKRINRLIEAIRRDPDSGPGKPELLRHSLSGARSRRIDKEHRLVYVFEGDYLVIMQARYHY